MKLGLVQMTCAEDRAANLDKAIARVREAAKKGAQVVCLEELFLGPYFPQAEDYAHFERAEAVPGPTTEALAAVAKETKSVVVASIFERRAAGVYHNTAAVIDAGGAYLGKYRKMHIPDDPAFYEKFYFTPGDLGYPVFATKYGRLGVLVCWDQWYPEAARLVALGGAELILYPTAIGWHPSEKQEHGKSQHDAWETIQRGHAIANGVFVAAVNRVGVEKGPAGAAGLEFFGGSFVADPFGRIVGKASHDREEVLVVDCDLHAVEETRRHWPFLRDRRIDSYPPIAARLID